MDYIQFGKNVSQARLKKGYTQEKLAEMINVSTVFISQIETAVRKPSLETAYNISIALNISLDSLFGRNTKNWLEDNIKVWLGNKTESELEIMNEVIGQLCSSLENHR